MKSKVMNSGSIYARCQQDKTVRVVKFKFGADSLCFEYQKKRLFVSSDGVNLYCHSGNRKKTQFCDNYTEALNLLLEVDETNPLRGQLIIKDIPFFVSLYPAGFVLICDLGVVEQTYMLYIENRQIFVVKGDITKRQATDDLKKTMEPCDNFLDALKLIYTMAYSMLKEILNDPVRLN